MLRTARNIRLVAVVALIAGVAAATEQAAAETPASQALRAAPVFHRAVCSAAAPGRARCLSEVVTDAAGAPLANLTPSGYRPQDLRSAYDLGAMAPSLGTGHTIAIVAAFDDPAAEADVAAYRAYYGLPPCTSATGCFTKRDQHGGLLYPSADAGWGAEIALDLEMASAICPNCRLLLVEASSNALSDLNEAVNQAAALGATEISNSWGGSEYPGEVVDESVYNRQGIAITASAGDDGYGVGFPAASRYVTAVGGTSLVPTDSGRGWTESVWSDSGGGCSAYVAKPAWQSDVGCAGRTVADVAAVADPATGVAVFHNDGSNPSASGWMTFGGTSVAAPVIAGIYALKGHAATANPLADLAPFNDITSGSNGACGSYLCQAGPGFDGPSGFGSPDGGGPAPVRAPAGPPTTGQPVSSASASKGISTTNAAAYARTTLRRALRRSLQHARNYRASCRALTLVSAVCRVSWRSGAYDFRGSVTVTISGAAWRASYAIQRTGHGCRAARPKGRCAVTRITGRYEAERSPAA